MKRIKDGVFSEKSVRSILLFLSIASVVVLLISLIPILWVSFYEHPLWDDYGYSALVRQAILDGGGFLDVLKAAAQQVKESYVTWQGTFSAIFLFSLQPGVFSENLYFLTTFILVISLLFSTYFFVDTFVVVWMKSQRCYGIIVSSLILFCSIQFMPDAFQGFYWYNGAIYYTFFYSVSLIFYALLIRMFFAKSKKGKIALCVVSSLIAIFIGGGNYATCLFVFVVMALLLLAMFYNKSSDKWLYVVIFGVFLVAFAVSVLAPGNSLRSETEEGMNPVEAVFYAIIHAATYIGKWTDLQQVVIFIFLSPIIYRLAEKAKLSFKQPFLVIAVAFLCFASQLTPSLYASSGVGNGRLVDIYYYSYYFLILFSLFYLYGWIGKQKALNVDCKRIATPINGICCLVVLVFLFGVGCAQYGYSDVTSVKTAVLVMDGSASEYEAECERVILEIESGKTHVEDVENVNSLLPAYGFKSYDDDYINADMAEYYGVDYFYLKE